jgi:integrase
MVEVPQSLSPTGKRQRHFYTTRDKANDAVEDLRKKFREHGGGASVLPPSAVEEYLTAAGLARPWKITVLDAVRAHVDTLKAASASLAMKDAWDKYTALKESTMRPVSYRGLVNARRRMANLDERTLSALTARDVETELEGLSPTTANNIRRNVRALIRWAAHPSRGWCDGTAAKAIETAPEPHGGEIETLTPAEVERLLRTAEKHFPELVAPYALGVFGGIRRKEIERLQWSAFVEDGIVIARKAAKKLTRRVVPWNDALRAWIKVEDGDELVAPPDFHAKDCACRRLAGWNVAAPFFAKSAAWKGKTIPPLPPTARPWPKNSLRHTHASAAVATGTTLSDLILYFGHRRTELLQANYATAYPKKDAIKLFSIAPKGRKIETVKIAK